MPGRHFSRDEERRPVDYVYVSTPVEQEVRAEVLAQRASPSWWERHLLVVPAPVRRIASAVTVLTASAALVVSGLVLVRDWLVERRQAQVVSLGVSLGVWASSTSPFTGGQVVYYASVRNRGIRPLKVTSIEASDGQLQLRARDGTARWVPAGSEILVPMSALLTCSLPSTTAESDARGLHVDVGLRRDGGLLSPQRTSLDDAALILDVAETLCGVRPELRGYELSGPVIRAASTERTED